MIKDLEKLKNLHGAAQVCVWLGIQDTRTLNTWISRKSVPYKYHEVAKKVINKRRKK